MLSLKTTLATIFVPGTACLLVPFFILRYFGVSLTPAFGAAQVAGSLIIVLGIYMIVWVSNSFVRQGKGTPVPIEPPKRLVVQGLYHYMRNPMYFGAVLTVLGEAVYFQSEWLLLYAAALWLVLHIALVTWEEQDLRKRFGLEYEQYLTAVPRWLPRIPGWDPPTGRPQA